MPASLDKRCSRYLAPNGVQFSNFMRTASSFGAILHIQILDIWNERVRCHQNRGLVTLLVTIVPSMLEESIEIEVFSSAKVLLAVAQAMELARIE